MVDYAVNFKVDALKHQLDEAKENAMQNGVENIAELKKKVKNVS
jgi:hypothetical protein